MLRDETFLETFLLDSWREEVQRLRDQNQEARRLLRDWLAMCSYGSRAPCLEPTRAFLGDEA